MAKVYEITFSNQNKPSDFSDTAAVNFTTWADISSIVPNYQCYTY